MHARADTPVHSLLHEACHLICAAPERRATIHTDGGSDRQFEEDATCYLQIVLGDALEGVGGERVMRTWMLGYTFRPGSARAWFEHDAGDARDWLQQRGLLPLQSHAAPSLAAGDRDH